MHIPRCDFAIISLIFVLAALLAVTFVDAAECTADDLMQIEEDASTETKASASTCASRITEDNFCDDTECLNLFAKLMESVPDCTLSGYTMDELVTQVFDYCGVTADDASSATSAAQLFVGMNVATLGLAAGVAASLYAASM